MLTSIHIKNLGSIADAEITLSPGLTVITGETGAGKTMLSRAIAALSGGRIRRAWLREPALSGSTSSRSRPATCELSTVVRTEGERSVRVRRVIGPRATAHVDAKRTPVAELRRVMHSHLDVCSQHAALSLGEEERVLEWLDAQHPGQIKKLERTVQECARARQALDQLMEVERDRQRDLDRIHAALEPLTALAPRRGEYDSLVRSARLLADREELEAFLREATQSLSQTNGSPSTLDRVARLDVRAQRLLSDEPTLTAALTNARRSLEEAVTSLEKISASLETAEHTTLEAVESRVFTYQQLARRHRVEPAQLYDVEQHLQAELYRLDQTDTLLAEARAAFHHKHAEAQQLANGVHRRRLNAAKRLSASVNRELTELCLGGASVEVRVRRRARLDTSGVSEVGVFFSAAPTTPPERLDHSASGGELSRVALAFYTVTHVLAGRTAAAKRLNRTTAGPWRTLVFDEIDAGVGGKAAAAVGRRLAALAKRMQVVCITHSPQVAAYADCHLTISKASDRAGVPTSSVRSLDANGRVVELARMLDGERHSQTAIDHARALLSIAGQETPALALARSA